MSWSLQFYMEKEMAKYKLTEGILTSFVGKVMDNIIDNNRKKNQKALKKAGDKQLEKLEKEAAQAVNNFKNYVREKGYVDDEDAKRLGL